MIHLELSDPSVKRLVSAAYPGYTGRDVRCVIGTVCAIRDTNWSGGYRREYVLLQVLDLKTLQIPPEHWQGDPKYRNPADIPQGCVIVVHVNSGNREHIEIYTPAEFVTPTLKAPTTLTWNQQIVLAATRGLKSSYAGISNYRYVEANRETGITEAEYEAAKAELIRMGHLNARGAISISGKNAIGSKELYQLKEDPTCKN